eukprot:8528466-Pyramimonas_sp.AAC.1
MCEESGLRREVATPPVVAPVALPQEVETGRAAGASVVAAMRPGGGNVNFMCAEAPFALMCGYRGQAFNVDVLS